MATTSAADRLAFFFDQEGRGHATLLPPAREAVRRFDELRERTASFRLAPLRTAALVLLSLVLFDLVLRLTELRHVWSRLARPLAWRGRPFVSWVGEDGRCQRRFLNARTVIAAAAVDEWPFFEVAATDVAGILSGAVAWRRRSDYSIEELLKDGSAWALANLPPFIALSVIGVCPLACVPDPTLARESSGARLAPPDAPEQTEHTSEAPESPTAQGTDLWRAVDAALACPEGTNLRRRRAMVSRLAMILSQTETLSEGEYLCVSWFIELVKSGTPTTSPITPGTAADYVRRVGQGLLASIDAAMAAVDDPLHWFTMYSEVIAQADEGSRHKAHAALTAFHEFAVAHVEAPRLRSISSADVTVAPPPRADRLWPHEVDWIREQLGRAVDAPAVARYCRQMIALFELLLATGARSSDILALRMADVRFFDEALIISIDPRPTDGSLKTTRSRRPVRVEGEEVIANARRWTALRESERATATSLYFGCPDGTHRVWRRVASLVGIGLLIKEATGVRLLGPHLLRHTRVTEAAESIEPTPAGERQFHALAASLGHGADVTTHRDYNHSWDRVLYQQLKKRQCDIVTSWDSEADWLGISATALRKRASRSALDRAAFIAKGLDEAVVDLKMPDVSSEFNFIERTPPDLSFRSAELGFADVLAVCREASADVPVEAIAARTLVELRVVRRILRRLAAEARVPAAMEESDARLRYRVRETMDRLCEVMDFSRLGQPKMTSLVAFAVRNAAKPVVLRASLAWERVRRGAYLSLERAEHAREFLEFLRDGGVIADQLVVVIDFGVGADDVRSQELQRKVLARFADIFDRRPALQYVRRRGGRPRTYLLFRSRGQRGRHPAAVSVAGLQALMLAASIWRELVEDAS